MLTVLLKKQWMEMTASLRRSSVTGRVRTGWKAAAFLVLAACVVLLVIGVVMCLMMWGIEQVPIIWNTGVTATEENRVRVYRILKNLLVTIRLVIAAIFAWMTDCSARSQPLGSWFMPLTMLLVFGPIVLCLLQLYRKR